MDGKARRASFREKANQTPYNSAIKSDKAQFLVPFFPAVSPPMTEPKNEPVRIVLPAQTPIAPVRLVSPKITPLPAASELQTPPINETARFSSVPPVPVRPTSSPLVGFDAIPPAFRWLLFGFASVNFLIQIWIYVVS